ncbi:Free methionine-R-sulfoxide reductase [Pontiella desulfatans]|uniref:Free methionine-R-sulfoxide reductase n=1 Tax=Pontiella desulfatans TaxID=2750659 RepID=A0A6C2TW10_PONDE|nr:GAF domain-containing protein [Pontiella desulfatans]VGO11722.1 Free methionine-R-sulfoxide reductase [Pontiella desulfatans]
MDKPAAYEQLFGGLDALCGDEPDAIARMATIACELNHAFDHFDWVGFYRNMGDDTLKIGPYQGTHGCLSIPFSKGVCGKCAREMKIQHVPDVDAIADHIACSSTTRSEVVIPMVTATGELVGVLDIDSNTLDAFDETDLRELPKINRYFE